MSEMDMPIEFSEENRLGDLIAGLRDCFRRRWRLFLGLVVLVCLAGGIWILTMKPTYEATARLRIDPARNPMGESVQERQASLNPEALQTEVSILRSSELAIDVMNRLQLRANPVFLKSLPPGLTGAALDMAIVDKLQSDLRVSRQELTYVIEVGYLSRDPAMAARTANTFVDAYLDRKLGKSTGTAARQSDFLRLQLDELGGEARQAEVELAKYRAAAGLVETSGGRSQGTMLDEQIAALSSQLAIAESAAAAAQAAYMAALNQQSTSGAESVSEVRSSSVIADLRKTRAETLRTLGETGARYGEKHPENIRARQQLSVVDSQIQDEAKRIVSSLNSDAKAAQARANSLRSTMASLEAKRLSNAQAAALVGGLESEANSKRAAYDQISQLSVRSSSAARNPIVQVDVIDRATLPADPISPNRPMLFSFILLASLAVGGGGVSLLEAMSSGLRSSQDIERRLGIPFLAAVPAVSSEKLTRDFLLQPSPTAFSEAIRIAQAALAQGGSRQMPKVIALPSALPGEGKSTTALALAGVMAAARNRVLLVECDIRRAALSAMLAMEPPASGLVQVLSGEAELGDAIVPSGTDMLDLLLVREPCFTSPELFGTGNMGTLLDRLKDDYDIIILDVPPLIGLADARILCALADANIVVVRWNETPSKVASSALALLRDDGSNVAGAIYTMVDSSAEVVGGLYYKRKYAGYYQESEK
jgi:succinoglycan biosynthesis transport protein ExoP